MRRTDPVEIESPVGLIRVRRPTLLECGRLGMYRADPLTDEAGIAEMAALLDGLGFVLDVGGKPVTALAFLLGADVWTVQVALFSILAGSSFDPSAPAAEAPAPKPERPKVSPE